MRPSASRRAEPLHAGPARRAWQTILAVLLAGFSLLCAPSAGAEDREVIVRIAGREREARDLRVVLQELLSRVPVTLHVSRVARFEPHEIASPSERVERSLAAVWLDLHAAKRVRMYLYSPAQDRLLVRNLERVPHGDEVLREELAHIVHTAVEGVLSGDMLGLPREQALPLLEQTSEGEAPAPPAARAAPTERTLPDRTDGESESREPAPRKIWQARLAYRASAVAGDVMVAHGPVAELVLRPLTLALEPGLIFSAQYTWPARASTERAGAELQTSSLGVLATVQHALDGALLLRAGLGAGLDWVRVTPFTDHDDVRTATPSHLSTALLRAALELEARLSRHFSIYGALGLDIAPSAPDYVLVRREGDESVLSPWPARPSLSLGVALP
ncbi:MAG TPA: hypothetical protein VK524_15955 [Polyangiaceae bacterium]|nr:hypothetical protein [Polyangiaceae bacterium]